MSIAYLFPGQGAQYPGMGKDFLSYTIARETFEEADDLLNCKLSDMIFNGPGDVLTQTKNSQAGIYVASMAILRVIQETFPQIKPAFCAGLSLGEYTATTAAGYLNFRDGLSLVQYRGQYMNDACEKTEGQMAVVLGLDAEIVEEFAANIPGLWVANFNCPGQVVISGTPRGIEAGTARAQEKGAKRVLPLNVHGAFHSGLMQKAKESLVDHVQNAPFSSPHAKLVMNVTGKIAQSPEEVKRHLIDQVTHSVRWEQGIHEMESKGATVYMEIGPGAALTGFNKRIGVLGEAFNIEKVDHLTKLETLCANF